MFEVSDGVLAMTAILTEPDALTEEIETRGIALTNSITFNGTTEDLMMSMMSEE
jgi:hypothetical protein